MAQNKIFAVFLLFTTVGVTICEDNSMSNDNRSSNNSIITSSEILTYHHHQDRRSTDDWQQKECMKKCPIEKLPYYNQVSDIIESRQIHIGLLLPSKPQADQINTQTLAAILPVVEVAIKNVKKKNLLIGYDLRVHPRDTKCSSTFGPLAAFDLHIRDEADVFFGPVCDYVLAPVARYASVWQKPVISTAGYANAFNIKSSFPTLIRMMSNLEMTNAIKEIVSHFNWKIFGFFFHTYDDASKGYSPCHHIIAPIYKNNHNNTQHQNNVHETFENVKYEELKVKLDRLKLKSRIIIMCANQKTIREIMIAAEELNMIDSGEYVFFNIEIFGNSKKDLRPWYDANDGDNRNEQAKKAYQALLTINSKEPEDEEYFKFSDEVKLLAKEKFNYTFSENEQISQFVSAFHDAVLLFAHALNQSIVIYGENALVKPLNGTRLLQLMWNRSFRGITGNVSIDENGDRRSDYSLLDMNSETGHFEIVGNYLHKAGERNASFILKRNIHWSGGRTEPPADSPECGFDNSLCPEDSSSLFAILSMVLGLIVIIMAIISFVSYRHYRLEAEINSMTWRINWNEVIPVSMANHNNRGSIHSRMGSQLSVYSEELMSDKQIFIPIGCYKGKTVAIKKINMPVNLTRSLMMELKTMKDNVQHDHLVRFYGAVIDNVPCMLTEYCPKGSLQDILENHEINLDWMFKLSLMHDIVKGMHYLHTTPIHSHGQLKSSNCVVDSRFVLKITDFGLHELRKSLTDDPENKDSYEYWKKYLWSAPELLRASNCPERGTQKGDVYSFAIIVQEICCRQGVFYLGNNYIDKTPQEIIELVSSCPIYPNEPFRPIVDSGKDSCCDVNNLMISCWAEDPLDRPEFSTIKSMIRKINKENESGNILDNLLKRMEHYAQNLENLVDERTRDYLEEKKKCEDLLYQLLPVPIASQLIEGKPVIAEMYDQVTIYFSDIVGFTAISSESTPMQVVDLLNDLYTCFDKIVGHFDVYKVETIGDAYMVVSGLPVRNGDLHAREIARMALALLAKVHNFKIAHRPDEKLKLRIGLHSGPCCAGVVGLKMPRYCLFGDTVNTASRMESNGEALKIHISQSTKQILDKFETFDISLRGYVSMKGKGEMMTFWLNGEKAQEVLTLPTIETHHYNSSQHINHDNNNKDLKFIDANHVPDEKPKTIAIVSPLTPQNSFNSKKSVTVNNASLRSNLSSYSSLKDLSHQPLLNGKKSLLKKKQINFNNDKLHPLLMSK